MTRDRIASQRGVSMLLVVVVILVTLLLVSACALLQARAGHLEAVKRNLLALKEAEIRRQTELTQRMNDGLEATGLRGHEAHRELSDQRALQELGKRADVLFEPIVDPSQPSPEGLLERERLIATKRRELGIYPNLQALLQLASLRLQQAKHRHDQLKHQKDLIEAHARSRAEAKPAILLPKTDYANHLAAQNAEVVRKIQEAEEEHTAQMQAFNEAKTAAEQGHEEEEARFTEWSMHMRNQILKKQDELEEMKVREAIRYDAYVAHGRVLKPDVRNRVAFIDIGSRERVVPGLKFLAAKRGRQGRLEFKAELEVKKVWPTHSEVSVPRTFRQERPVIEGDLIINPLFGTRRPVVVALTGHDQPLKVRPSWSHSEVTRRIREIGSEVRTSVDTGIDFLIFSEPGPNRTMANYLEFTKAVALGIPWATANRSDDEPGLPGIYEYLGD